MATNQTGITDEADEVYVRMRAWVIDAKQRGLSDAEIAATLQNLSRAAAEIGKVLNG